MYPFLQRDPAYHMYLHTHTHIIPYAFVISLCVALCEENPTRLAISAVIGLTQGFVPVVTTQPEPDEVDGCVQKETLLQGRDAAILGSKEDELLRKSKIGPVGELVCIQCTYGTYVFTIICLS